MQSLLDKLRSSFLRDDRDQMVVVLFAVVFECEPDTAAMAEKSEALGESLALTSFSKFIHDQFHGFGEKRRKHWEKRVESLLDECPSNSALQIVIKGYYKKAKNQEAFNVSVERGSLRWFSDNVWALAQGNPAVFIAIAGKPRKVGLAAWGDLRRKGQHPDTDLSPAPTPEQDERKPISLPPWADDAGRKEEFRDGLVLCMRWILEVVDLYVPLRSLYRCVWEVFCTANHVSSVSRDAKRSIDEDGSGGPLLDDLKARPEDIREWEYGSLAEGIVASLSRSELTVLRDVMLPWAYGEKKTGQATRAAKALHCRKSDISRIMDDLQEKLGKICDSHVPAAEIQFFVNALYKAATPETEGE